MKLREHLYSLRESPNGWARRHGIPKDQVYRHLNGKPIEYENAKRISEATKGAVSVVEIMEQQPAPTKELHDADPR